MDLDRDNVRGRKPSAAPTMNVPPGMPDPPADLGGDALAEWSRVATMLAEAGVITKLDGAILARYCRATANLQTFQQLLDRYLQGLLDDESTSFDDRGLKLNNAVQRASSEWRGCAAALGLLPASRKGVKVMTTPLVDDQTYFEFGT